MAKIIEKMEQTVKDAVRDAKARKESGSKELSDAQIIALKQEAKRNAILKDANPVVTRPNPNSSGPTWELPKDPYGNGPATPVFLSSTDVFRAYKGGGGLDSSWMPTAQSQKNMAEKALKTFDETREKEPAYAAGLLREQAEATQESPDGTQEPASNYTGELRGRDRAEIRDKAARNILEGAVERADASIKADEDREKDNAYLNQAAALPEEDRRALDTYRAYRNKKQYSYFMEAPALDPEEFRSNESYIYLTEKYGADAVKGMAYALDKSETEKTMQATSQYAEHAVDSVPGAIAHSALSVGANLLSAPARLMGRAAELQNRPADYNGLSVNTVGDIFGVYSEAVRGKTAQNIAGDGVDENGNPVDGGALRQFLAYAYQGGMSAADSLARAYTFGGGGGAVLAAAETYGKTLSEATANGASPEQAAKLAATSAAIEAISEKLSLDKLLTIAKGGSSGAKKLLMDTIGQGAVEVGEEELSFFLSTATEAQILRGNSSYQRKIGDLVASGMSYADAKAQADKDILAQAGETALVSFLSGTVSGGAAHAYGDIAAMTEGLVDKSRKPKPPLTPALAQFEQGAAQTFGVEPEAEAAPAPAMMEQGQAAINENIQRAPTTELAPAVPPADAAAPQPPAGDMAVSRTFSNSGLKNANANVREAYRQTVKENPDATKYEVKHNADTLADARSRTETTDQVLAEYDNLTTKNAWTAEDVATSTLMLDKIMSMKDMDSQQKKEMLSGLQEARKNAGSDLGQKIQAFAIQDGTMQAGASPATAIDSFRSQLNKLTPEETTWKQTKDGPDFETWKKNIQDKVDDIGIAIACVDDGDAESMRSIIRDIARYRKTTAWFGMTNRLSTAADAILKKQDFETLKTIANIQLASLADDYRARTKREVLNTIRKQNMLKSLKTIKRNIYGNSAVGLADALSESGAGRMADAFLSKFTGKRTVGNDLRYAKEYVSAAWDAAQWASLCVELDIPIETDAQSSYSSAVGKDSGGKYIGKTFRAAGNPAMRAMYAFQKYMSYALEVTDKVFEGGTKGSVRASLEALNGSNLTGEDVDALSDFTANKRTFKNAAWTDSEGKEHGANLARIGQGIKDIHPVAEFMADAVVPYVQVSSNSAQTGIDYGTGWAKGAAEIASIIRDAKAGKEIDVRRQRQAASDFGRGVSGVAMVSLATSAALHGIIKVHNDRDRDKRALEQSEGLSGLQVNWDAWARSGNGESTEWRYGDTLSSLDFLEPFDTVMYMGYELAQEEDLQDMLKAYPAATVKSVANSLMDTPAMSGLAELVEFSQDVVDALDKDDPAASADAAFGELAELGGDYAASYIPQYVRQTAQYMDGYYRDTAGASPEETAMNKLLASLPWASEKLPVKYDPLGKQQKRGGFLETFVDPTKTTTYRPSSTRQNLDSLFDATGDISIYPDAAKRTVTYTDREGNDHKKERLSDAQYETMQKEQGQTTKELLDGLFRSPNYAALSDAQKAAAVGLAKQYAVEQGKQSALPDYHSEAAAWMKEVQGDEVGGILRKVQLDTLGDAIDNMASDWKNGWDVTDADRRTLDELYDSYDSMPLATKAEISKNAEGDTKIYLEAREKGVSNDQYLNVLQEVSGLKVQPGYSGVRPAQTYTAIASDSSLTESAKDALLHAYMPDSNNLDEYYDYARKDMRLSPEKFTTGYDIYSHEDHIGGKGTAARTRARMQRELGLSEEKAAELYKLLSGRQKP